jgi:hypothetical protein
MEDPYMMNAQKPWDYPLPDFGGLYIPNATVFRDSESNGYAYLKNPEEMSFIACYSYKMPPIEVMKDSNEERLSSSIVPSFLKKMDSIFEIALENKHDSVVLSAFGVSIIPC